MVALFVLLWSGLTFHQTLFIGYDEEQGWRMYHNIAGLCLVLGFALGRGLALLSGRWPISSQRVVMSALLLAAAGWVLGSQPRNTETLGALARGKLRLKNDYSWDPAARCGRLVPISREALLVRAKQRQSLACYDLSFFDLSSIELRGADLRGADLTGSLLRAAWLEHADLRGAGLSFASAEMAHLKDADLRGANLTGANFNNVDLTGARLDGAVMVGTFRYNITMEGSSSEQVQQNLDLQVWRRSP